MDMYLPSKILDKRRNEDNDVELKIVWALFEDDESQYTWENIKDLPEDFVIDN